MKCDKLKVETIVPQGSAITLQMYGKAEVDEAIAKLKAENKRLKEEAVSWMEETTRARNEKMAMFEKLANVNAENESIKVELIELRDAYRWRKVTEELPEDETEVPVILDNDWRTTDYYEKDKGHWHYHWHTVAYWFKIPKV